MFLWDPIYSINIVYTFICQTSQICIWKKYWTCDLQLQDMKCQLVFNNIFNQMFFIGIKQNTLESKWKGWEYIEGHLLVMWGSLFFIDIFKHNLILVTLLKCLPFMIYENGERTKCILFLFYNIEWSNKIILIAGLILYIWRRSNYAKILIRIWTRSLKPPFYIFHMMKRCPAVKRCMNLILFWVDLYL